MVNIPFVKINDLDILLSSVWAICYSVSGDISYLTVCANKSDIWPSNLILFNLILTYDILFFCVQVESPADSTTIGLQMGSNKGASQSGMSMGGVRHVGDISAGQVRRQNRVGFFLIFYHSFFLCHLESRTRLILTPYDGWCWWHSNLRTPTCESPALPLRYGCRQNS